MFAIAIHMEYVSVIPLCGAFGLQEWSDYMRCICTHGVTNMERMGCLCPCVYFNLVFDLVRVVYVTVCVSVYVCDHMHVCMCVYVCVCVCYITGLGI